MSLSGQPKTSAKLGLILLACGVLRVFSQKRKSTYAGTPSAAMDACRRAPSCFALEDEAVPRRPIELRRTYEGRTMGDDSSVFRTIVNGRAGRQNRCAGDAGRRYSTKAAKTQSTSRAQVLRCSRRLMKPVMTYAPVSRRHAPRAPSHRAPRRPPRPRQSVAKKTTAPPPREDAVVPSTRRAVGKRWQ